MGNILKNEPLTRDTVSYIDGIHLTGESVSLKSVKSAVEGLKHDMFEWCNVEDDMNAVEIMIKNGFQ